eukprot:CAMPEP_0197827510 /NCGR_PEP_ID=MMETSP1437-20131217/4255_1 /TAXON_ID=49252 ORGANISM="Eucampia antarctica, Strain CCMP1452" /NCGR_SAMPLE_ID=MMETSP1437 /ASSEMBLY_ACC=CAM_ASM_001096 /LENGTH=419 /DNA_ID=CAMNT_0043428361 /DNA_START=77 /DNA_END=1336 /DNA_ORIENTATION=+
MTRSMLPNAALKGIFVLFVTLTYDFGNAFQLGRNNGISRRFKSVDDISLYRSKAPIHLSMSSTSANARASTSENTPKKSNPPQLVEFIEPKTKTKVILIGTMHYNPTSINMVQNTLQTLAEQNSLGSVIVESCDIRWNTTMDILGTPRGKLLEPILKSEMKAATDEALKYGRPCILGDQRINATGESLGETFRQTFVEIASPLDGGWNRLITEFKDAVAVAFPTGEGYLSPFSILDPRLLIAAPVSFAKYPLSFLARNPISTLIVFSFLGFLTYLDASNGGGVAFADATLEEQAKSLVASLLFSGLEFGLFGRILVQVLLAERNEIIAKNILDQCKIYSPSNNNIKGGNGNFMDMFSFLSGKNSNPTTDNELRETMYVPGSIRETATSKIDDEERVVVAVLGMAHCNGIIKLLKEELVE